MSQSFAPDTPEAWKARIIKELKDTPYEDVISKTEDGIEIQPYYTDAGKETILDTGSSEPWRIRQEFDADDIEEKNALIHEALMAGVDSISVGVSDLEQDLEGVSIEMIDVEVAGEDFHPRWLEYVNSEGQNPELLKGGYAFDPLGGMMAAGRFDDIELMPMILKTFSGQTSDWKHWHCVHIQGDMYHNSGATVVQELAYTTALINEYLEMQPALAYQMAVTLSASSDYFETASKLRAFYVIWANLMEVHGLKAAPKLFVRSSERELAPIDMHGNLLRATTQAMAAIAGGAQQISLLPYDGMGDIFGYRMSRNIQVLLKHESHMDKVINPMKGAYLFEELTESIASDAWSLFKTVEANGGWSVAATSGVIQEDVLKSAEHWAKKINAKELPWLGVNLYPDAEELDWKGVDVQQNGNLHLPTIHHQIA